MHDVSFRQWHSGCLIKIEWLECPATIDGGHYPVNQEVMLHGFVGNFERKTG
jgi:hypothetical protein